MMPRLLLLPGDGIGPEVMAEAIKLLPWLARRGLSFETNEALVGGAALDVEGVPIREKTLDLAKQADAILFGAVGSPKHDKVDFSLRPEVAILSLRKELALFANLRPALVFDPLISASSLKPEIVAQLDLMIVRELTGGIYFGEPRGITQLPNGEREGINTQRYQSHEIVRVARVAFDLAQKRTKQLCSVEKANVMESGKLWREEVTKLAPEYPDVTLSHMYADNCAMQLVKNPRQFDVIVTDNLFGDILSDEASMLTGSLGMLPSASLGARQNGKQFALYEPIHGSAPDIAGKGIANPIAMILSLAMMLRYSFAAETEAQALEDAVRVVLTGGVRTADLGGSMSTKEMGEAILAALAAT